MLVPGETVVGEEDEEGGGVVHKLSMSRCKE